MKKVMITTIDNPYNPSTQFGEWLHYDVTNGYFTCERLASLAKTSNSLSDQENQEEIEKAMDQLIKLGAISNKGKFVEYKKLYSEE